jgi:probable rRNA maturation factor
MEDFDDKKLMKNIKKMIQKILTDYDHQKSELNVVLCGNDFIRGLNRDYRKKDSPTDVLSFSQTEGEDLGMEISESLGDVIISIEKALEQSKEFGAGFPEEMARLAAHGTLHLLGFDHEISEEAEAEMLKIQDRYVLLFNSFQ